MNFKIKDLGIDVSTWPKHLTGPHCKCKGDSASGGHPGAAPAECKASSIAEQVRQCKGESAPFPSQAKELQRRLEEVLAEVRRIANEPEDAS